MYLKRNVLNIKLKKNAKSKTINIQMRRNAIISVGKKYRLRKGQQKKGLSENNNLDKIRKGSFVTVFCKG